MEALSPSERPANALIVDNIQLGPDQKHQQPAHSVSNKPTVPNLVHPPGIQPDGLMSRDLGSVQDTHREDSFHHSNTQMRPPCRSSGDQTQFGDWNQKPLSKVDYSSGGGGLVQTGNWSSLSSSSRAPSRTTSFDSSNNVNLADNSADWDLQEEPVDLSKPKLQISLEDERSSSGSLPRTTEPQLRQEVAQPPPQQHKPQDATMTPSTSVTSPTCDTFLPSLQSTFTTPGNMTNMVDTSISDASFSAVVSASRTLSDDVKPRVNQTQTTSDLQPHFAGEEKLDPNNQTDVGNVPFVDFNFEESIIIPFPEIENNENLNTLLENSQEKMLILSVDADGNNILLPQNQTSCKNENLKSATDRLDQTPKTPKINQETQVGGLEHEPDKGDNDERLETSSPELEAERQPLEDLNYNTDDQETAGDRRKDSELTADLTKSQLITETLDRMDSDDNIDNIDLTDIVEMLNSDSGSNKDDSAAGGSISKKRRKRTVSYRIRTNRMLDITVSDDESGDDKTKDRKGFPKVQSDSVEEPEPAMTVSEEENTPPRPNRKKRFIDRTSRESKQKVKKQQSKKPNDQKVRSSRTSKENQDPRSRRRNNLDSSSLENSSSSRRSLRLSQMKEPATEEISETKKRKTKKEIKSYEESESEPETVPVTPIRLKKKPTVTIVKSEMFKCKECPRTFTRKRELEMHSRRCSKLAAVPSTKEVDNCHL